MYGFSIQIAKNFDDTFDAVIRTADGMGKVLDESRVMGYIHFKRKFGWVGIPAKYIISVKKVEEDVTEVLTEVQPTMGNGQDVKNTAYAEFLKRLSVELE